MKVYKCANCGGEITYCRTWPDSKKSYFAHIVESPGRLGPNALMAQRCPNRKTWATPSRKRKATKETA